MTPLEPVEALIEEPKGPEVLAEEVGRNGGRCPTKEEMIRVKHILEPAQPVSSLALSIYSPNWGVAVELLERKLRIGKTHESPAGPKTTAQSTSELEVNWLFARGPGASYAVHVPSHHTKSHALHAEA